MEFDYSYQGISEGSATSLSEIRQTLLGISRDLKQNKLSSEKNNVVQSFNNDFIHASLL